MKWQRWGHGGDDWDPSLVPGVEEGSGNRFGRLQKPWTTKLQNAKWKKKSSKSKEKCCQSNSINFNFHLPSNAVRGKEIGSKEMLSLELKTEIELEKKRSGTLKLSWMKWTNFDHEVVVFDFCRTIILNLKVTNILLNSNFSWEKKLWCNVVLNFHLDIFIDISTFLCVRY